MVHNRAVSISPYYLCANIRNSTQHDSSDGHNIAKHGVSNIPIQKWVKYEAMFRILLFHFNLIFRKYEYTTGIGGTLQRLINLLDFLISMSAMPNISTEGIATLWRRELFILSCYLHNGSPAIYLSGVAESRMHILIKGWLGALD